MWERERNKNDIDFSLHYRWPEWLKKKVSGDFGDQRNGPALGFHPYGEFQPFPEIKIPNPSAVHISMGLGLVFCTR